MHVSSLSVPLSTGSIMNAEPSQPVPDVVHATSGVDQPVDPTPSETSSTVVAWRLPLWLLTLAAGLISGLISWAHGEVAFVKFRAEREMVYPENYRLLSGYQKQSVTSQVVGVAQQVAERKKSAASFGFLGLVLGMSLGLVGGWMGGSLRKAVSGAIGGALAGAAAGGGVSWVAVPLFFRFNDLDSGMIFLFMTHAAIFIAVGGACGLALGLGMADRKATAGALFGGLMGGFIGTIALETVYSLTFPLMRTLEPIASEPTPRLLTYLCVAVCTALFAGLATGARAGKPVPKPAP